MEQLILGRIINLKIMCLLMMDGRSMELIVLSDVIQIHIETWDRTALEEQEATFGRKRHSGAPLTGGKSLMKLT